MKSTDSSTSSENQRINRLLVERSVEVRAVVHAWASEREGMMGAQCARTELECSILAALSESSMWQSYTGSDLCEALGHTTLDAYVQMPQVLPERDAIMNFESIFGGISDLAPSKPKILDGY